METWKQGILCYVSNLIFFWFSSLTYTTRVTTIERKYFLHFILFWSGKKLGQGEALCGTREANSQGNRKRAFSPNLVSCTPGTAWISLWSTSRSSTPVSTSPSSFAYVMSNSTGRSSPISTFNMMSLTTQPLPSWTTRLMRGTTCSSRMWLVANVELYGAFLPRSTLISSMTCYTCFHFLRVDHTRVVYIMRKAAGTNHL